MSDGTIERSDERVTFRYERRLRHSIEEVWRAITDPTEIECWTGGRPEIELTLGGKYVTYHGSGDRVVDRIVRLEPPTLFEHTFWEQTNPSALVTWELQPIPDGCLLRLTHSLSMVARGDSALTIMSRNGAGWHRLLDRLEQTMDGRAVEWSPDQQRALQERYAAILR